ncbi:MAG TPA: winged helix DNA-binding domain-containing protein [Puia sp.]|jgi:hypothetical protein|nr:winged helix DNA-binding domain-containing protein [Puia sp.]
MTNTDIVKHRLITQQLAGTKFTTPKQMVSHFGALQAQDYEMAKWAIGVRLSKTEKEIEQAINSGEIIRTHILRPTWHFVCAGDLRWMLALTAPHVKAATASARRHYGLDDKTVLRSNNIIQKALTGGKHLTREELMSLLQKKGIDITPLRSIHLMLRAELDAIVCNGPKRGKQFTYALIDEKVPPAKALEKDKDKALAELAKRYFTSHGYATLKDFCWWSGLSVANAKMGLQSIRTGLDSVKIDNQTLWSGPGFPSEIGNFERTVFLPAYDEFMVGYKDRSASLGATNAKITITSNGIFKPTILINGKVEGIWRRTFKNDQMLVEPHFFKAKNKLKKKALAESVKPYGDFLGMKIIIA